MISQIEKDKLERQQYRFVGNHSAVKTCGWTKKMLKGEGGCYKLKFYGIMSHQCLQMTTSMSCANRCVFCWRGYKAPVSKEWEGPVDDPLLIFNESLNEHHMLLNGYKGNKKVLQRLYSSSRTVKHVALSLTGEPITYPKINELIDLFHQHLISTFVVTNAQYPEAIKNINPVTQLYVSIDAPNKQIMKNIDLPLFPDFWERFIDSLDGLAGKKHRTCVRLTLVKDLNMEDLQGYADLIHRGDPDFIEVKAYMFVGASRQRLSLNNMPLHEDIVAFSTALAQYLPEYDLVTEHVPSRVVLLAKKTFKKNNEWHTWINFKEFFEQGKDVKSNEYCAKTPITGISGKGTLETMKAKNIPLADKYEVWHNV